jgi:hypothetical protein
VEAAFRALVFMACEFSYDPEASKPKNLDDPFNDAPGSRTRGDLIARSNQRKRQAAEIVATAESAPLGMQKARPRP